MCEVENSEFSENSETSRISFPRFFTPSFPFCTIPKTENSELKTLEFSQGTLIKLGAFPTRSFPFCTILKTENSELKTSQFSLRHYNHSKVFQLRVFHFSLYSNGKLGVKNLGVFAKVYPNNFFYIKLFN